SVAAWHEAKTAVYRVLASHKSAREIAATPQRRQCRRTAQPADVRRYTQGDAGRGHEGSRFYETKPHTLLIFQHEMKWQASEIKGDSSRAFSRTRLLRD